MTRINVIPVSELMDQHLLAEHREITRLPKNLQQSLNRKSKAFSEAEISPDYVLGKGHVKFFMNKFKWLEKRFMELTEECDKRGFNVSFRDASIFKVAPRWYNDWTITEESVTLNKQRIKERIDAKPEFYRYYGEVK